MSLSRAAAIAINEGRISHIFRDAEGHFAHDTAANRQTLIEAADQPKNYLGTDRFGNHWYAQPRVDGNANLGASSQRQDHQWRGKYDPA
jgi:filamentous hemagglutinin